MTNSFLTEALASYARCASCEMTEILSTVGATAPAQRSRLITWLARCVSLDESAANKESLRCALRDLVTLRNAQLTFRLAPDAPVTRPRAVVTGDLGSAVALGQAVIDLCRCVAEYDPDLALDLLRDVYRTNQRQHDEIARAIAGS